jgi:Icc-related predicted phosphoesterase
MRCLLVSDLHYTLKQYDWVFSVADRFDAVVIAGDHLDIVAVAAKEAQIVVILKYLQRLATRTKLLVSSGNHDLTATDDDTGEKIARWIAKARDGAAGVDGDCVEIGGTLFTVCPWWDGPKSRDLVGEQLARDARRRNGPWVWVYHAPPDRSPVSWIGSKHLGDESLVQWIAEHRPDIVLTGHIHQSPFRQGGSWADRIGDTWVFNAGRQIGPCPTHVIIDTDRRAAMWFSLAGNEVVDLDAPLLRPFAEYVPPQGIDAGAG